MKKILKIATALALTISCAVGAAACDLFEGNTHSNLTKEGWEEIVEYAENLKTYRVICTWEYGGDLYSQTYESDIERPQPRLHYSMTSNLRGTITDEYLEMDADGDTFHYAWEHNDEITRWTKWNETPSEGDKNAELINFQNKYDTRKSMLGYKYYVEGNTEGIGLKGLYDHLTYSRGLWVGDMEFEFSGASHQCSVEVENMPDSIESFRANKNGLLFRLKLSTTINGELHKWIYDIQNTTSGFITTLPANAEFVTKPEYPDIDWPQIP